MRHYAAVSRDVDPIVSKQTFEVNRQMVVLTPCLQLGVCSPMLRVWLVDQHVLPPLSASGLLHILRQQAGEMLGDHRQTPRA